ncbi:zinc finger and SCAN domain-containing protein 12-like [Lissotriton helveticus]
MELETSVKGTQTKVESLVQVIQEAPVTEQTLPGELLKISESLANDIKCVKIEPEDDPEEFLLAYGCSAEGSLWIKDSCEASSSMSARDAHVSYEGLPHRTAEDYDRQKGILLDETEMSEESFRKKFRNLKFTPEVRLRTLANQLEEWCRRWLKPEIRSPTDIVDLIILEQFVQILPQGAQDWLSHLKSVTSESSRNVWTVISKQLLQPRKKKRPYSGKHRRPFLFRTLKKGVRKKRSPKKSRRSQQQTQILHVLCVKEVSRKKETLQTIRKFTAENVCTYAVHVARVFGG